MFLIIDGNSLFHRSYHGVKPLSNSTGVPTNAIFGFLNTYISNVNKYNPKHIAVAFDLSEPTFRHEIYPEYKGNRTHMEDNLAIQLPYLKQILQYLGVTVVTCPKYEADDILGTLSKVCNQQGLECKLLSGDKDIFQLITENTHVLHLKTKQTIEYSKETFVEEFGYQPINIIDYKAIAGDSSDNIKGIAGIGEKTTTPLIQKYGSIENIYAHLDEIQLSKKYYSLLCNGKQDATMCKQLATIDCNAPIDTDLTSYEYHGIKNETDLLDVLSFLEMDTFIKKFKLSKPIESTPVASTPKATPNIDVSFITKEYISNSITTDYLIKDDNLYIIDKDKIYQTSAPYIIKDYLLSNQYKRTIHYKEHYKYSDTINNVIEDAELFGYLLQTSSKTYTVKSLCKQYDIEYFDDLGEYADIYSLPMLNDILSAKVYDLNMNDLSTMELEVAKILAHMEDIGIKVDLDTAVKYQHQLEALLHDLELQIYQLAGQEFTILSPKPLGKVLFETLGLPHGKKTKTGYSTDAETLEGLIDKHPIVKLIIDYRFYYKMQSNYIEGIIKAVSVDQRVHTVFRQTETRTGRLSSAEPNLQNIPIRSEFSKNIRKLFVADEGKVLIDADYNQIELRLTAIMSDDDNMKEAFLENSDVHTATAMDIFHCTAKEVTPERRTIAKSINFGIIYGMGAFKLSNEIGVPLETAKAYIEHYFLTYPKVKSFMDTVVQDCEKTGYVKTILNRIRYIPEIRSTNRVVQNSGKRIAMNTPIQGSCADIIKLAMIKVYNRLLKESLDAKIILQVHDELLIEASKDCAEYTAKIVKQEMENVMKLSVPLTVEVKMGGSWYDAH